jgi:hypothetical protein
VVTKSSEEKQEDSEIAQEMLKDIITVRINVLDNDQVHNQAVNVMDLEVNIQDSLQKICTVMEQVSSISGFLVFDG